MKLYGSLASPFVARCWLTVTAKGGGADLEMYDGGIKSDSYLALNPMGKMPLLVDGDTSLPESGVICEYLDETLPGPALMPKDVAAQARVRLLCRIVDLYVFPPVVSLLRLPKDGDAESIETAKADTVAGLNHLEHFLANTGFACGTSLTLAVTVRLSRGRAIPGSSSRSNRGPTGGLVTCFAMRYRRLHGGSRRGFWRRSDAGRG